MSRSGVSDPFRLENPSEFPNVIRALLARGYSDEDIEKAVGGNILRALGEVWV